MNQFGKLLALGALRFYKIVISPWLGPGCRFQPSCSEYTRQSVEKFGAIQGLRMGLKRLSKCHPFHEGGFDPVP